MVNEAIQKNVDEIYVTTFEKQESLIYLLKQYVFYLLFGGSIKDCDLPIYTSSFYEYLRTYKIRC